MGLRPLLKVSKLQEALHTKVKGSPNDRFYALGREEGAGRVGDTPSVFRGEQPRDESVASTALQEAQGSGSRLLTIPRHIPGPEVGPSSAQLPEQGLFRVRTCEDLLAQKPLSESPMP